MCVEFLTKELSCIPKVDMVRVVVDHGVSTHTHRHMDKLLLLRYMHQLLMYPEADIYIFYKFSRLQLIQV